MSPEVAVASKKEIVVGASSVISRFTMRRSILGMTIFGLFAAVESLAQSVGIVAAYPDTARRANVIYGLADNAALGLFYGDKHGDIVSGGGYMEYRILPILALVGAIWALTFITRMLRGQEENGRWELMLAGQTTTPSATANTIIGAGGGLVLSYGLLVAILAVVGLGSKYTLSLSGCLLYGLAVIAGCAIALGIGAITSQLAATRRQAVMYGLVPILIFFALRSIGNVVGSLEWLKYLTPFGWIDKLHPFYQPQAIWLLPIGVFTLACCSLAIWLSGKRDMADSFIADSSSAKPKLRLLNSQLGFNFRLARGVLTGWLIASVVLAGLIAAIDKSVAKSLSGSGSLAKIFSNLSGNPYAHFEVAYLSAASYFSVIILMIVATTYLGAGRQEEASSRLDNFVSGTLSRRRWLSVRLCLLVGASTLIALITNLTVWSLAEVQGIHLGIATLILSGLNILGPVILLMGVGILVYGFYPRAMSIVMYLLIGWSFTADIVSSLFKSNKFIADTSLLHYMALVPAASPNWRTFSWLIGLGFVLLCLGKFAFQRRDLQAN